MTSTKEAFEQGKTKKKFGCMGCLGIFLLVCLLIVLCIYAFIFHSSIPIKAIANALSADEDVQIIGVDGSLASGFSVQEIIVKGEDGDSSIDGLTFRYSGIIDLVSNNQLIIEELSADKMDFIVGADFFDNESTTYEFDYSHEQSESAQGESLKLFELRELDFAETRIRTEDGSTDISIPLIRIVGLKIEDDLFELEALKVESDYVTMDLVDAKPMTVEGQLLPFTRAVSGTVFPKIHTVVESKIDFQLSFGAANGKTLTRFIAFDGAYEQFLLPTGDALIKFNKLSLSRYFDTTGFVLPEDITLTASQSGDLLKIEDGNFLIGKTSFTIPAQSLDAGGDNPAVTAEATQDKRTITALISSDEASMWPPLKVKLSSKPSLPQEELLSRLYFNKSYTTLTAEQKAAIDSMLEVEPSGE